MIMKKTNRYLRIIIVVAVIFSIFGCEKRLTDMNINKVDPTAMNPYLQMNSAIIGCWTNTQSWPVWHYAIVQQILTPTGTSVQGANYNQMSYQFNYHYIWNQYYTNPLKNLIDVIEKTKDDPEANVYNCARIFKAYVSMVITDTYGDCRILKQEKGYLEDIKYPVYDKQEDIYMDLLKKELGKKHHLLWTRLLIHQRGYYVRWKYCSMEKLGYSLMLRTAMRLVKVDVTTAETWAKKQLPEVLWSQCR